ncbi:RND transporter [Actinophytocola xinjiangensis]|uniref:RND transporter n=1 Tax=Actinophytocola xinjiangensis TaxID=485602 RepID=A0A7Z0WMF7_9PSEU|nr:MMPL family transporter [Actinophytocola xinjiangensis]OLF08402.1 RND transporter [Actinophytocola xinjiangensis]
MFVAVCFAAGSWVGTNEATDEDMATGESGRATAIVNSGDFDDPAKENVIITARSGDLDQAAAAGAAADVREGMLALPEVTEVADPVASPDGRALLVQVTMREGDADEDVGALLDETAALQRDHPDLRVEQVGGESIDKGIWEQVSQDLTKAEFISLPVTLVIMLIAFGAIIAAGVPVLLAMSAVGSAFGLAGLASHVFPAVETISSVILLMGMAVGVDYSLFYLKREREERQRGNPHVRAVEIAAATSGHAVVVSGFAVMVSMAGLYLTSDAVFTSLATGSIIVVAVAVLGSLTVLPALLAKLGRFVDRPRVPLLWRLTNRSGPPRVWPTLLRPALRYPLVTLLITLAALGALAWPALDLKLKNSDVDDLPRDIAVMRAYDRMTESFPSEGVNHVVAVRAEPDQADEVRAALGTLYDQTRDDPLFASVADPRIQVSDDGRVSELLVPTTQKPGTDGAADSLDRLREDLVPAALDPVGGEHAVGGQIAADADSTGLLEERMPWVIGFVLLLTFVIMFATFRSIAVALTALLLNSLSAGAAFGTLVLVFQNTWAEGILGFHSNGAIVAWIPLFLFAVLFGLSMDYHVFVVSRIREAARRGLPNRQAVEYGITRSAGVVTSAAMVMVSVFAIFATLSMSEMKQMGVGLAVAVFVDAMVIRVLVLPSLMALLGRANWWPGRIRPHGESQFPGANSPSADRLIDEPQGVPHPVR